MLTTTRIWACDTDPKLKVTVALLKGDVRAVGFAVSVIAEDVFAAAGVTVSQLAELLVVNDTAS